MNPYLTILISVVSSLAAVLAVFLFVPLSWFGSPQFGSTITAIQASDTVKDALLTIVNTNFTNLDNDKVELSDLAATTSLPQLTTLDGLTTAGSLATVGTITSGTWQGTTIAVAKGGTGSTTPTGLLWGDGAGSLTSISTSTAGQLLTACGTGCKPFFASASFDTTQNYVFTGHNTFASLFATLASSTHATTTNLWFTGITSSLLKTDSNGKVTAATAGTDYARQRYAFATTTQISTTGLATTTAITIPAGVMTASSTVQVDFLGYCSGTGTCNYTLRVRSGSTWHDLLVHGLTDTSTTIQGPFDAYVISNGTNAQRSVGRYIALTNSNNSSGGSNDTVSASVGNSTSVDFTQELTFAVVINGNGISASLDDYSIIVDP